MVLNPAGGLAALGGTDDVDRVDARAAAAAKACFQGIMVPLRDHLGYNMDSTAGSSLHSEQP
jgi:hypothetical protein